jgi:hypothetical protein
MTDKQEETENPRAYEDCENQSFRINLEKG